MWAPWPHQLFSGRGQGLRKPQELGIWWNVFICNVNTRKGNVEMVAPLWSCMDFVFKDSRGNGQGWNVCTCFFCSKAPSPHPLQSHYGQTPHLLAFMPCFQLLEYLAVCLERLNCAHRMQFPYSPITPGSLLEWNWKRVARTSFSYIPMNQIFTQSGKCVVFLCHCLYFAIPFFVLIFC